MSDGFKKIVLEVKPENQEGHTLHQQVEKPKEIMKKTKHSRKLVKFLGIFILFLIILGIILGIPLVNLYSSVKETYSQVKVTYDVAKKQDVEKLSQELKKTEDSLNKTKQNLNLISWTRIIPFVGGYTADATRMVNSGIYGVQAGEILVEAVKPYADLLGLKGQGSFTGGSAEERIVKVVQTLDKVTPEIDKVAEKLKLIRQETDKIDQNRYPASIQGKKVKENIVLMKNLIDQAETAVTEAKPIVEVLPQVLGQPDSKRYLVLFQNDKELRPTGGFITAYAIFRIEKGKIIAEKSDDIYKLDDLIGNKVAAPDPILKYLPKVPYWHIRDSNISPDFKTSMQKFEEFYDMTGLKDKFDGIFAMDTQFLVSLMKSLEQFGGPIKAYGTEFSTKIDARCNCPQVVYELEAYADKPVAYERGSRKDIIGVLMQEIMKRSLGAAKQAWGTLFQTGITAISEKHMLFYFHDTKAQKGAESLNIAGRVQETDGDYLYINDTNFGGAKSNMYVSQSVDQKIEISSDGTVTKSIVISYKNPFPGSDCNLERGNLCLNGELRDWIRLYVPKGSKLVDSSGSEVKVTSSEDLGKTVFEGFFRVRPLGSTKLTFKYTLPFKVQKGSTYPIIIQKQPGTDANEHKLDINGHKEEFKLNSDKEFKIKI